MPFWQFLEQQSLPDAQRSPSVAQVAPGMAAQRPEVHLKLETAGMSTLQAGLARGSHELVLTTQPVRRAGLDAVVHWHHPGH